MRGHHAGQRGVKPFVRRSVVRQNRLEAAFVNRHVSVGISLDKTVARKMFAAIHHAGLQQTMHHTFGQQGHHTRVAAQGTVANDAAFAKIQIEHGCKAEVDTAASQLGCQHITASGGGIGRAQLVLDPQVTQRLHGRQMRETVRFETLNAPAFMVHANQQIFANGFDAFAQAQQLLAVLPVAREQDQATNQRIF